MNKNNNLEQSIQQLYNRIMDIPMPENERNVIIDKLLDLKFVLNSHIRGEK